MTNYSPVKGRRALAFGAAVALSMAGVLGSAAAANAAPVFGNIAPDASGSITIHKHEYQTGAVTPGDPEGGSTLPSPIAGVTFTAYKLTNFSVTNSANWGALSTLNVPANACTGTPASLPGGWTLGAGQALPATAANGTTTLALDNATPGSPNAKLGAYLICETGTPASPVVIDRAAPFVVTVPFPDKQTNAPSNSNGWLYDVHVYPKNSVTSVSKTILPQTGLGLGSTVQFPVTVRIPSTGGADFTSFDIVDTFDARLTPTGVASVTVGGTAVDPALYTTTTSGQTVTVTFSMAAAAQTYLKNNAQGAVVVTFRGTVQSIGNGTIPNAATAFINAPGHATGTGITSNQVTTTWGNATVLKTDSASPVHPLQGAAFQVYAATSATAYPGTPAGCTNAEATGTPLTVGGASTFTSGANGIVTIPGLFVSDSVNAVAGATFRCYIVVETAAPAGFVTPAAPNNARGIAVTAGVNAAGVNDATVANVQQDVPQLPLTGANGQVAMVIGGIGLLAVAGGLMLARRRAGSKR